MAGFRSRVADVLSAIKGSTIEPQSVNTDDATIAGKTGIGINGSTNVSLSLDTWRQPSTDRPTLVLVVGKARTDGNTDAFVTLEVDESGGTSRDYLARFANADAILGSGAIDFEIAFTVVPSGGQYQIGSGNDPVGENAVEIVREFVV